MLKKANSISIRTISGIFHPKSAPKNVISKQKSSQVAETSVILEKCLEHPIIALNEDDCVDLIGPPDTQSNLRPIVRKRLLNETISQQKLREMQDETQSWNQKFWATHNTNFIKERKEFIDKYQNKLITLEGTEEKRQLTADEMSEFYKYFLDKNWENHVKYNLEWYKRNFALLFLSLRVVVEKSVLKFNPI